MTDLIDRQACDCISRQWLMECVNEGWIKFDTEKDENRFIHLVRDIAPSAQPDLSEYSDKLWKAAYERGRTEALDEIVRCKDCKHSAPNGRYGCRVYHYKRYETHDMKPDDFCSYAERKTNE